MSVDPLGPYDNCDFPSLASYWTATGAPPERQDPLCLLERGGGSPPSYSLTYPLKIAKSRNFQQ